MWGFQPCRSIVSRSLLLLVSRSLLHAVSRSLLLLSPSYLWFQYYPPLAGNIFEKRAESVAAQLFAGTKVCAQCAFVGVVSVRFVTQNGTTAWEHPCVLASLQCLYS